MTDSLTYRVLAIASTSTSSSSAGLRWRSENAIEKQIYISIRDATRQTRYTRERRSRRGTVLFSDGKWLVIAIITTGRHYARIISFEANRFSRAGVVDDRCSPARDPLGCEISMPSLMVCVHSIDRNCFGLPFISLFVSFSRGRGRLSVLLVSRPSRAARIAVVARSMIRHPLMNTLRRLAIRVQLEPIRDTENLISLAGLEHLRAHWNAHRTIRASRFAPFPYFAFA